MLLLTGATGAIGRELLPRLLADGSRVRCLVRDPRVLGSGRVDVQIALGDPSGPGSLRHALRGIETVVHLAGATRDRPGRSIEEHNVGSTWRLARAAREAGVARFLLLSTLGASSRSPARFARAKAASERALVETGLPATVLAASLVYGPGERWSTAIERLALGPFMPLPGAGRARVEPIAAADAADVVRAALRDPAATPARIELAGPQEMAYRTAVRRVLNARAWPRRAVPVPLPLARAAVRALEVAGGPSALLTRDELELLTVDRVSAGGSADARALGVLPRAMLDVLTEAG